MRIRQIHEDATTQTYNALDAYLKRIESLQDPADIYEDMLTMIGIQKKHRMASQDLLRRQLAITKKLPDDNRRTIMAKLSDVNRTEDIAQREYEKAEQKAYSEKTVKEAVFEYLKKTRVDFSIQSDQQKGPYHPFGKHCNSPACGCVGTTQHILIPDIEEPLIKISFDKNNIIMKIGSDEPKIFMCNDMDNANTAHQFLSYLDSVCRSL